MAYNHHKYQHLNQKNSIIFPWEKDGGGRAQAACDYELITLPLVPAQIFLFSDLFSLGVLEEFEMFGADLDH